MFSILNKTMIEKTMLVSNCESQCKNQILNYHFNTNFLPMFLVFLFALIYMIISHNREWLKGKYIENGIDADYVDNMEFVSQQLTIWIPLIYFIWYYLHFIINAGI